jgi:hypothetical protein
MSAPTSSPAVVVVGPNSEFSATMSSKCAPVRSASCASSGGMSGAIEAPVTTPIRCPSVAGSRSSPSRTRSRSIASEPDAVLDLREVAVVLASGQLAAGEQVQLVGAEHPGGVALAPAALAPRLDESRMRVALSRLIDSPSYRCENWVSPTGTSATEITASPSSRGRRATAQHVAVVEPRHDHHLAVELDASAG